MPQTGRSQRTAAVMRRRCRRKTRAAWRATGIAQAFGVRTGNVVRTLSSSRSSSASPVVSDSQPHYARLQISTRRLVLRPERTGPARRISQRTPCLHTTKKNKIFPSVCIVAKRTPEGSIGRGNREPRNRSVHGMPLRQRPTGPHPPTSRPFVRGRAPQAATA